MIEGKILLEEALRRVEEGTASLQDVNTVEMFIQQIDDTVSFFHDVVGV
jgi:hypothetical protein